MRQASDIYMAADRPPQFTVKQLLLFTVIVAVGTRIGGMVFDPGALNRS